MPRKCVVFRINISRRWRTLLSIVARRQSLATKVNVQFPFFFFWKKLHFPIPWWFLNILNRLNNIYLKRFQNFCIILRRFRFFWPMIRNFILTTRRARSKKNTKRKKKWSKIKRVDSAKFHQCPQKPKRRGIDSRSKKPMAREIRSGVNIVQMANNAAKKRSFPKMIRFEVSRGRLSDRRTRSRKWIIKRARVVAEIKINCRRCQIESRDDPWIWRMIRNYYGITSMVETFRIIRI